MLPQSQCAAVIGNPGAIWLWTMRAEVQWGIASQQF